jgi:trk system potassium uptake protein
MLHSRKIFNVLGFLLIAEGFFIMACTLVSLFYHENDSLQIFISGLITSVFGFVSWVLTRNGSKNISIRDGYIIATSGWLLLSFFGALPFFISRAIPSFTDAFFETISGYTTTGATILTRVESLTHGILFWRSLTQWLGGMGIILLSLAVLPVLGIGGMQLFTSEISGAVSDKLHPRISDTAKRLWIIYIVFTLAEILFLRIGKMNFFDAVCTSFSTLSTGGFSTKSMNIAFWESPYLQYVIILFMFIAGTNFTLSYFGFHFQFRKILKNDEFRYYLGLIASFTLVITFLMVLTMEQPLEHSFRNSFFQVVSIITTTGFITSDFSLWTPVLWALIIVLMFFGACVGSTGGGMKIMRILLITKNGMHELIRLVHPKAIIPVRFNGSVVYPDIITNVLAFVCLYLLSMVISMVVLSIMGYNLDTSLGVAVSMIGNVGPGLGSFGPLQNYSHLPDIGKWFLSFLMLVGRLELFTVLVLFTPAFWRK